MDIKKRLLWGVDEGVLENLSLDKQLRNKGDLSLGDEHFDKRLGFSDKDKIIEGEEGEIRINKIQWSALLLPLHSEWDDA